MSFYGLEGKKAIITGAAGGVGAAMARELSAQGCEIAIIDIKDEDGGKMAEELNRRGKAKYYRCDIADISALEQAFAAIIADFGGVDILINNAGVPVRWHIQDMTSERWDWCNGINMKAPYFLSKMAAPYMAKKKWGRIINVSSIRTRVINDENHTGYAITKAAVESITKNFAVIYGRHGITTNALALAYVITPMTEHYLNEPGAEQRMSMSNPQKRMIDPSEVADVTAFLVSDKAKSVNAQVIFMDGGASFYSPVKEMLANWDQFNTGGNKD
ncbi:MAG: SDR family oxidoreductase [Planctomycetaceae bacterium]|nr:SDR family oxidoreductase [Planctomycetaceae bacterium]